MMIKVSILNLARFLETVNHCEGSVCMLDCDGSRTNITRQYSIQKNLETEYLRNGRCLPLSLIIEKPKDYMAIVCYYAGDC